MIMNYKITILLALLLTTISSGFAVSESCTLNLLWGHGGAGNVQERIRALGIKGRNIYQGCGVGGSGNIKYQVWQTGYNGDWMGSSSHIDNGGFIPTMTLPASNVVNKLGSEQDKKKLKSVELSYAKSEEAWAIKTASILPSSSLIEYMTSLRPHEYAHCEVTNGMVSRECMVKMAASGLIKGVLSSGFARLTQYHWAALVKEADDLLRTQACKEVSMNFICHDEGFEYMGDNGQTKFKEDLGNPTYSRRVKQAKFDHINIDKSLLTDISGNSAVFENATCYESNQSKIERVPRKCGESHLLNAEDIKSYKSGPCGEFLSNVTTKYKKTRSIAGRAEIFSPIREPSESPTQGSGTFYE